MYTNLFWGSLLAHENEGVTTIRINIITLITLKAKLTY